MQRSKRQLHSIASSAREATAPHLDSTTWCLPGCLNARATVRRIAADLLQRHVGGLGLKPDIRVAQNLRRADFC